MTTSTNKFKIGDKITIVRNSHEDSLLEDGSPLYSYFDQYIGRQTTISEFNFVNCDGENCWYTNIDHGGKLLSVSENDIELS